jgi:hypothetical protein
MTLRCAATILLFMLSNGLARAASPPTVVELFTSQGCSSCPPADALLGELAQRTDVVALAFHVDYWDRLGWRDPFALPLASERQRHYARSLAAPGGVFTPQAIVSGQRSVVGSDRARLVAALAALPAPLPLQLSIGAGRLSIVLTAHPSAVVYDVNLVAYRSVATTRIGRGENGGRTLTEYHIVRAFRRVGGWDGGAAQFAVELTTLPEDADRVAVLLQRPQQGAIAGAGVIALN